MRVRRFAWLGLAAVTAVLAIGPTSMARAGETRLLRFPDIHGDTIVFCHGGDLWRVQSEGGMAVRLTAHPGLEIFPRFSPDGRWIAFTGQYDGDEQVYVMPAEGGAPRQLTWYPADGPLPPRWGFDNIVYGWSPDGREVLFRSLRPNPYYPAGRLYTVSVEGGLPEPLPMPRAGAGDFSPDGRQIVYSPLFRDFRTWKRYEGGWAEDLYLFDLETLESRRIAATVRTERDPMWVGDTIYFTSDRDGRLNLYAFDLASGDTVQLTHHRDWDVRWPGADADGHIVYELNGALHVFNTKDGTDTPLSITVPSDELPRRPARVKVADKVEDVSLAPDAHRLLFVARGDVFSVPAEKGPTRNLTRSSGAHDRWARWSPDGEWVAFISDQDGEDELYVVVPDGRSQPRQVTDGGVGMRFAPEWSPTGTHIAFSDKDDRIHVVEVETGRVTRFETGDAQPWVAVRDYTWSPDGRYLAFSAFDELDFRSIYIWSLEDGQVRRVTEPMFDDHTPAWDPSGQYLYFLSRRTFAPQISDAEWNFAVNRATGVFALALRKDVPHPFPPESDEVGEGDEEGDTGAAEDGDSGRKGKRKGRGDRKGKASEKAQEIVIDWDGIAARIAPAPVPADNYSGLAVTRDFLIFLQVPEPYYGRRIESGHVLTALSFKDRKIVQLATGVTGFEVSRDGKKALIRTKDGYALLDVKCEPGDPKPVSLAGLSMDVVPEQEWAEIFDEVWRRYRDFFYVANMHGYDWAGLRDRYRPLLAHVSHRDDLNYLIGEMIAELNVGHAYVEGGDLGLPERPGVALLGAVLELDRASGRYRIAHLFQGENGEDAYRAPLSEVGVSVAEGEYLLAIDGVALEAGDNPYRLLRHKVDQPVVLAVSPDPNPKHAREVTIHPVASEHALAYLDWVERNRARVDAMSEGRIGYLHIPDMGAAGGAAFIRWYYPQLRKEALVVDVRDNGGGNISPWIIERLSREWLGVKYARGGAGSRPYPGTAFIGPKACLVDETTCSDGDIFAYMFRKAGLGPLVGKRTWGGVVGITGHGPLIDGGRVYVPEGGMGSVEGEWIIEGHGVEPDLEVELDPAALMAGRDLQLEKAVQVLLEKLEERRVTLPPRPPDPVKTP